MRITYSKVISTEMRMKSCYSGNILFKLEEVFCPLQEGSSLIK